MKQYLFKFKNWCNANSGWLAFWAIVVSIFLAVIFPKLNLATANSFFENIMLVLSFSVVIPIYLFIITCIVLFLYFWRVKRRYQFQFITEKFLVGTWKNEWLSNGRWHSETLQITEDFKYVTSGEHWFNVVDFKYDPKNRRLEFTKVSVRPNEIRKLANFLTVKNNDLLVGLEENTEIKYSRI